MSAIERHGRWLLYAYPRWYREDRADEMLGTLAEASGPDRSWPSLRDGRTLILGGLRVRAGMHQRLTAAASLSQAVLLAAVLVLAAHSSMELGFFRGDWGYTFGLTTLAAMAGAWFGPPKVVAAIAFAAAGLCFYLPPDNQPDRGIVLVLALAVIVIWALRRQRLPRLWLWLAGAWYLVYLLPWLFPAVGPIRVAGWLGPFIILAVAIAWSAVDIRPMLAVAICLAVYFGLAAVMFSADRLAAAPHPLSGLIAIWPWDTITVASILVALVAVWRLRRQTVL
jgi:hypothetical protein